VNTIDPRTDARAQAKAAKAYAKATRPWYPQKRTWIIGVPVALVAIGALTSGGNDSPPPPAAGQPAATRPQAAAAAPAEAAPAVAPLVVTADEMLDALEGNALAASTTYKGKLVQVTGKVYNIDSSGDYFGVDGLDDQFTLTGLHMRIGAEHLPQVQEFTVGQTVVVTGTVTSVGEVLGYAIDVATIG